MSGDKKYQVAFRLSQMDFLDKDDFDKFQAILDKKTNKSAFYKKTLIDRTSLERKHNEHDIDKVINWLKTNDIKPLLAFIDGNQTEYTDSNMVSNIADEIISRIIQKGIAIGMKPEEAQNFADSITDDDLDELDDL